MLLDDATCLLVKDLISKYTIYKSDLTLMILLCAVFHEVQCAFLHYSEINQNNNETKLKFVNYSNLEEN